MVVDPERSKIKLNNNFLTHVAPQVRHSLTFNTDFCTESFLTNLFLTKIVIKQDPQCSFCSNVPENLIHLFWHCPKVITFWKGLTSKLLDYKLIPQDYLKDIAVSLA